jgi:multiple sugar transport system ATP-binding protein
MGAIEIRSLGKRFGAVDVLKGVDLSIEEGEFVVLVGPSGCGKSTLLRLIAGLEDATAGDIVIAGKVMTEVPPQKRNIAMVFQSYALYPHLTVARNIGYGPKLRGEAPAAIERKVREAASGLNLSSYLERLPKQLSGGQRQRVAMGRALVREPSVFLFDEPLSNLDAKLRVQMRSEIKALQRRMGVTAVYVTHDQIEAMTMADRIVVMDHGRIEQEGAPLDLYDRPATLFVAQFLGSPAMNLVDGARMAQAFGAAAPLPAGRAETLLVGIRPETVELAQEGLPLRVDLVEPTGAETFLHGSIDGRPFTVAMRGRTKVAIGETVFVRAASQAIHLFDRESGRRIAA